MFRKMLRPYTTAGVALVGAGVIAISPVAPPMPGDIFEQILGNAEAAIGAPFAADLG